MKTFGLQFPKIVDKRMEKETYNKVSLNIGLKWNRRYA